jgi:hypothetical protein
MAKGPAIIRKLKNGSEVVGALYEGGIIKILNVRASYPHLDKPYAGDDGGEPKFSIVGLADKATHQEVKEACIEVIEDLKKANKNAKVSKDKLFIKNGDDSDKEEYEGMWAISARETKRPKVRDGNGDLLEVDEIADVIYPGCYVDIIIRPWFQDNSFGRRCNANLLSVKFRADGEQFGDGRIDDDDLWDEDDEAPKSGGKKSKASDDDDDDDL